MAQNHTVISLDDYRKSKEGVGGTLEKREIPPSGAATPETPLQTHTYTEIEVPVDVAPYITVHQEHPQISDEVRKLGVQPTEASPTFKEPSILTELGLTVEKVVKFLEEPLNKSSRWYAQHAHRQLRKSGQELNAKTGEVLGEKAA